MDYARYCSLTFDGVLLDQEIEGYMTINVEGRGILDRAISSIEIPARDGVYITDQRLMPRVINVYYLLKATNSKEFQDRLDLLHALLDSRKDVIFKFGDEDFHRVGRLSVAKDPPYDQLQGIGRFTLFCQDPYRYSDPEVVPAAAIPETFLRETTPLSISVTITAGTNRLKITNSRTGKYIQIDGNYEAGQTITFVFGDKPKIYAGTGQSILPDLDLFSDFENFGIRAGDQIIVSPASPIEIIARKKVL